MLLGVSKEQSLSFLSLPGAREHKDCPLSSELSTPPQEQTRVGAQILILASSKTPSAFVAAKMTSLEIHESCCQSSVTCCWAGIPAGANSMTLADSSAWMLSMLSYRWPRWRATVISLLKPALAASCFRPSSMPKSHSVSRPWGTGKRHLMTRSPGKSVQAPTNMTYMAESAPA